MTLLTTSPSLPQSADEYLQVLRTRRVLAAPDTIQEGLMRQQVPGVAHKVVQQPVLNRGQLHEFSANSHLLILEAVPSSPAVKSGSACSGGGSSARRSTARMRATSAMWLKGLTT
jgi:hypothetical protein